MLSAFSAPVHSYLYFKEKQKLGGRGVGSDVRSFIHKILLQLSMTDVRRYLSAAQLFRTSVIFFNDTFYNYTQNTYIILSWHHQLSYSILWYTNKHNPLCAGCTCTKQTPSLNPFCSFPNRLIGQSSRSVGIEKCKCTCLQCSMSSMFVQVHFQSKRFSI